MTNAQQSGTSPVAELSMYALSPKADITELSRDVRLVS